MDHETCTGVAPNRFNIFETFGIVPIHAQDRAKCTLGAHLHLRNVQWDIWEQCKWTFGNCANGHRKNKFWTRFAIPPTPADPNAFRMCSIMLSLNACRFKCDSYVLKCKRMCSPRMCSPRAKHLETLSQSERSEDPREARPSERSEALPRGSRGPQTKARSD